MFRPNNLFAPRRLINGDSNKASTYDADCCRCIIMIHIVF